MEAREFSLKAETLGQQSSDFPLTTLQPLVALAAFRMSHGNGSSPALNDSLALSPAPSLSFLLTLLRWQNGLKELGKLGSQSVHYGVFIHLSS